MLNRINSVEFNEKYMNNNVMWSGKEWITDSYPPKISQDVTEFMSVEENEDVKEELKNYRYIYVWTGNDYLHIRAILIIENIICKSICTDFQPISTNIKYICEIELDNANGFIDDKIYIYQQKCIS